MKYSTLGIIAFFIILVSSECVNIGHSWKKNVPGKEEHRDWTSGRETDSGEKKTHEWTPGRTEVPGKMKKKLFNNEKAKESKSQENWNAGGTFHVVKQDNFLRAKKGSLYYEQPFRPTCQGHCDDSLWKTAKFEYNWHHSDNFYDYTGYPKEHKWEVHDPHSCIGEWDGRPPGLFVKKNVWVQKNQDGVLGGLIISANAFNPMDEQYREFFDSHVECHRQYPRKKTLKDQHYHQYTTGMVSGVDEVLYGYFEVRAKTMPTQLVNSFWFQGTHGDIVTEIDVFENVHVNANESKWRKDVKKFTSTNAIAANRTFPDINHPKRNLVKPDPEDKKHYEPISARPHTYGLLWTKERIVWFFDGGQFAEINNTHWHKPQRVRFDVETNYGLHGIMPDPAELKNDTMQFIIQYYRYWKVVE